jgi:hypothetical protein
MDVIQRLKTDPTGRRSHHPEVAGLTILVNRFGMAMMIG